MSASCQLFLTCAAALGAACLVSSLLEKHSWAALRLIRELKLDRTGPFRDDSCSLSVNKWVEYKPPRRCRRRRRRRRR